MHPQQTYRLSMSTGPFAYVRVSTARQTTENQIQEIEDAGFAVTPRRVVSETVSGSSAIEQRPGFVAADGQAGT